MVIWAGKRVNKFRNAEAAGLQTKNDNKTCILKYFINPLTSRWVGRGGRGREGGRRGEEGWAGGEFGIQKGYKKVRWLVKEAGKAVNKFSF